MGTNNYFQIILGVLTNFYVIGTVLVMILVVKFAKFVASYRKKPRRPKVKKGAKKPVVVAGGAGENEEGAATKDEGEEKAAGDVS